MNVFITLDYEIFFGHPHGTIEKTILYPTDRLIQIGKKEKVNFTFFIDVGFLLKLKEYRNEYPNLGKEYTVITNQIKQLVEEGHDCQLHIHPHWEKTSYNGNNWVFDYNFYKLSDFSNLEILDIFKRYAQELKNITGKEIISYRAGGWCIQPFDKIKPGFIQEGIKIDSSVFVGGKNTAEPYYYDFTNAPHKDFYYFKDEIIEEDKNGIFIQLPISSYSYSPFFFWRLFILGNLFPKNHKPIGDGKPMPSAGTSKFEFLTKGKKLSAGIEGYFVTKMKNVIIQNENLGYDNTVFLGHPKALTHFSLNQLERFICENKNKYSFKTFSMFYDEIR